MTRSCEKDCTSPAPSSTRLSSDNAVFSDNLDSAPTAGTPPSSPPCFPWERSNEAMTQERERPKTASPPHPGAVRNVFSVLGKRKALVETSDNVRPKKQQKPGRPADAKPLTQMQMKLGQKIQTKCKDCGMEYVASSLEDRKLHVKFHKQSIEGCDVGKSFVSNTDAAKLFAGVKEGDAVVQLDCYDHGHRRNRGQAALEIMQRELGAVAIPKEEIWDVENNAKSGALRYRSYLYVRETKCIGYLLVEAIGGAQEVTRPSTTKSDCKTATRNTANPPKNALEALRAKKRAIDEAQQAAKQEIEDAANHPIQLAKTKRPATLGVSRIWTSSIHRGQGIAACLLDAAIQHSTADELAISKVKTDREGASKDAAVLVDNVPKDAQRSATSVQPLPRHLVAFSQPTDSGAKLARKWFGRAYGWSVYMD